MLFLSYPHVLDRARQYYCRAVRQISKWLDNWIGYERMGFRACLLHDAFRMDTLYCRHPDYITMTSWWARWGPKSPASRLFTQPFVDSQIKEYIKAPRHWSLCKGNSPVTGDFPAQKASNAENVSI